MDGPRTISGSTMRWLLGDEDTQHDDISPDTADDATLGTDDMHVVVHESKRSQSEHDHSVADDFHPFPSLYHKLSDSSIVVFGSVSSSEVKLSESDKAIERVHVQADAGRLQQIINNICSNAAKVSDQPARKPPHSLPLNCALFAHVCSRSGRSSRKKGPLCASRFCTIPLCWLRAPLLRLEAQLTLGTTAYLWPYHCQAQAIGVKERCKHHVFAPRKSALQTLRQWLRATASSLNTRVSLYLSAMKALE